MTAINGRWKLISATNQEEYCTVTKASDEYKEKQRQLTAARNANPDDHWEEFHVDSKDETLRRTIYVKGEDKMEAVYKLGVVTEISTSDGRAMKVSLGLVGDNKVTIHEDGPGFEVDGFIEAKGNELTLSVTTDGLTSDQIYTRIS